ncbi:MAG: hypothetical protein K5945_06015 [Bacteroidaceae bacterium]|nr:hypothetical protein [Bacteroidaceae bacterium]
MKHTSLFQRMGTAAVLLAASLTIFAQKDQQKALCIGNSFTFYNDSHLMLSRIAQSEGHQLKTESATVGGYTFYRHLINDKTMAAISDGKYDYVFLQDQSQTPAICAEQGRKGRIIARDARELADRIRIYSPQAHIWIEQTWAYPRHKFGGFGSMERFDELLRRGTKKMARKAHTDVSPIGPAFAIVRSERPDIELYTADKQHPSPAGTYLKSCVNYLVIYATPFGTNTDACDIDAAQAAYLRKVAERVVLK